MAERPNLLVFMSDQHSGRALGCEGHPFVRTPNLDALARRGVRFRHAYCGNPVCVPSRMTFLAGRPSSDIRVWSNYCELRSMIPTFAHSLGAAGYETVLCGRMHFHGADHRHGFEKRLVGDVTGQWPGSRGPNLGHIPASTTGQNRQCVEVAGAGRTSYQAFDQAVVKGAREYLRQYAESRRERPFMMVAGGVLPHCPFICPRPLFDEYYAKVDVPRISEAERQGLHPALGKWRAVRGVDGLSDKQVRVARAAYFGLVTLMDGFLGELFSMLAETGLAEDTAVIYVSDHGDMAGEHEMWWKSCFYEDSVSVPLIASWPRRWAQGVSIETPVSLLDLAPTLTELGGAAALPFAAGQSLSSFLRGQSSPEHWRDEIFSECCGLANGEVPARMMVRWPWKLVHHHGYEEPQLFNLEKDPGETQDLRAMPEFADMRDEMHARAKAGWDGEEIGRVMKRVISEYEAVAAWANAVRQPDPDHWLAPPGCNIFPE